MSDLWKKIKGWKGWLVLMAIARVTPRFLLKTRTGIVLVGMALSGLGITLSEEELRILLEILFSLISGIGAIWANDSTSLAKDLFEEEHQKLKEDTND